jgi:hypothetical protein
MAGLFGADFVRTGTSLCEGRCGRRSKSGPTLPSGRSCIALLARNRRKQGGRSIRLKSALTAPMPGGMIRPASIVFRRVDRHTKLHKTQGWLFNSSRLAPTCPESWSSAGLSATSGRGVERRRSWSARTGQTSSAVSRSRHDREKVNTDNPASPWTPHDTATLTATVTARRAAPLESRMPTPDGAFSPTLLTRT